MMRRIMHCGMHGSGLPQPRPRPRPRPQTPTPDPNPDPYQLRRVEYGWHTEFPDTLDALEVSK